MRKSVKRLFYNKINLVIMTEVNKKDQGYIKRDLCSTKDLNVIKLLLKEGIDIDAYSLSRNRR